jgi:hypothetical protein
MAIYHLSVKPVSRGGGKSAVAASAYRSGENLINPVDGVVHDYTRRGGVERTGLIGWAGDRQSLWGQTEQIETRKNARLAVEAEVAIPHELSPDQRHQLVADFALELAAAYKSPVDWAIHVPHRVGDGDDRNVHAHILVGCREAENDTLGKRVVPFDGNEQMVQWRERWAVLSNDRLQAIGSEERVDHRTLEAQREAAKERGDERAADDLDREPLPRMDMASTALERRGVSTRSGDEVRAVKARNAERKTLLELLRETAAGIKSAAAEMGQAARETAGRGARALIEKIKMARGEQKILQADQQARSATRDKEIALARETETRRIDAEERAASIARETTKQQAAEKVREAQRLEYERQVKLYRDQDIAKFGPDEGRSR